MLNRKSLVILAGLMIIAALMILISWSPATVTAQSPTPQPPIAHLKVVGIPGNPALPGAITATLSYITDTAVGAAKSTIANATTGLSNVPINVPVFLEVSAADPKNSGKPTWSLTKPPESKSTITNTTAMGAKFTPDVVGAYYVQVTLQNEAGVRSAPEFAFFDAGTYIGMTDGNCKQCHPTKVEEWAKTGHSKIMNENFANRPTYTETCIRCHTTGYTSPAANNGGFTDAQAKAGWKFPTFAELKAGGVWDKMPASVKNMANIQCEACHGPANEHVKNGASVMAASFENDTCNTCHAGGGHHIRGLEEAYSKHTTGSSFEEITGPEEQACQRCHSGAGFASFVKNPTNQAAWENEESYVGCPACHDPHDDKNYAQLRVQGKPIAVPFQGAKDVGLSGICETCHNNRSTGGDEYVKAAPGSGTPHYSSAAEMLSDLGGATYGQTVPNSPHGMMVGVAPVPNPATPGTFLWSKADDKKGNVPGPCVFCHMTAGIEDTKDAHAFQVGDHSFNMTSPDGKVDYGVACKSCHGEVKDFNLKAKADYDGNGKVEGVQDEVKGLLNVVWKQLEGKGFVKQASGYPYATLPKEMTPQLKGAWYNFRYVYGVMWGANTGEGNQGAASAIHNFKRSVALLQLSIKDLSGSLPSGMTELK